MLKVPLTASERQAVSLSAADGGLKDAEWTRRRLFGEEVAVSPALGGLTAGDERARAVVLLAIIASRLEGITDEIARSRVGERELEELRTWFYEIVDSLNQLFSEPSHSGSDEISEELRS